MKREILAFLKRERDLIVEDLKLLERGERRIIHLNAGEHDITAQTRAETETRWLRFEEIIAAFESGVA